jgi:SAM-dependent methyltransferase
MFSVISKQLYWDLLANPTVKTLLDQTNRRVVCMKHAQAAWMLSELAHLSGLRILEAGAGFGRVLRTLQKHERWALEMPNGNGRTVNEKRLTMPPAIRLVEGYLGGYVRDLPDNYFDVIYSISVVEHIPPTDVAGFFSEHVRLLRPKGVGLHAVDFYLGDAPQPHVESRIDSYLRAISNAGLQLRDGVSISRPLLFQTRDASASDLAMLELNNVAPRLAHQRARLQSVSLAIAVVKQ